MEYAIIVSDSLKEVAEESNATERGIIYPWDEISSQKINEDIIILDTNMHKEQNKTGGNTVIGEEAYDATEFFRRSLKNLLKSGRTVIALLSEIEKVHVTERKTLGLTNYDWLEGLGRVSAETGEHAFKNNFVFQYPDADWHPLDVRLVNEEDYLNTYFLNVTGSPVILNPDNSSIEEYSELAVAEYHEETHPVSIVVESWKSDDGEVINPDGNLVLLPAPHDLKADVSDWFNSLIEIGHHYSSDSTGIDQFNRVIDRTTSPALQRLYQICHRFPHVARQLENRYADRETIEVSDEYDVQDLFHALLRLFFDDIREEESAPSHGGSSPRIDFLVKEETIAIEIKITRDGRGNKKLKEELAEDKEHYRSHPDCETLLCFVYDPHYEVGNPVGFEEDLSEQTDKLTTEVIVSSASRMS